MRLADPPLLAQQSGIARRAAQPPGFCLLVPGPVERGNIVALGPLRVALLREQPGSDAQDFRVAKTLFSARPLGLRNSLVNQIERSVEITELGDTLGKDRLDAWNVDPIAGPLPGGERRFSSRDSFGNLALLN